MTCLFKYSIVPQRKHITHLKNDKLVNVTEIIRNTAKVSIVENTGGTYGYHVALEGWGWFNRNKLYGAWITMTRVCVQQKTGVNGGYNVWDLLSDI